MTNMRSALPYLHSDEVVMRAARCVCINIACVTQQDTLCVTRRGDRSRLLGVAGLGKLPPEGRRPAALQALGRQAAAAAQAHRAASIAIAVLPSEAATIQVLLPGLSRAHAAGTYDPILCPAMHWQCSMVRKPATTVAKP